MKRASDGQLLAAVLAVPVGALLLISALGTLVGETNTGKSVAIGCAMILSLSSLLPQMAGVRFATYGPRSLQNRIGVLGGLFATLAIMHMPEAEVTFGWAVLPLLILLLTVAFLGFSDISKDLSIPSHIKALRRHPRGLRLLARGWLFALALIFLLVGTVAVRKDATIAQGIWAWLVMGAFVFSFPSIPMQKLGRISDVRRFVLFISDVISAVALIYIFVFVQQFGAMNFEDERPILIGAAVGAFIGFGVMALRHRFWANTPN